MDLGLLLFRTHSSRWSERQPWVLAGKRKKWSLQLAGLVTKWVLMLITIHLHEMGLDPYKNSSVGMYVAVQMGFHYWLWKLRRPSINDFCSIRLLGTWKVCGWQ